MDWLKMNIKSSIITSQFGEQQGLRVRANWDPMIAQALNYMPQASTLEQTAEKADAQKQTTAHNAMPAAE
jgi:carboxyl-terminal processing protease